MKRIREEKVVKDDLADRINACEVKKGRGSSGDVSYTFQVPRSLVREILNRIGK